MKTQKGNTLLPVESKESFLRETLIKFARKQNVKPKLLESTFEVEVFYKEYYVFLGEVECNFTCSIGYNRTENYVEIERKQKLIKQYDGSSKWEWVNEPVNKTRTVTDWQPHSGTNKGKCFVAIKTNGEHDNECWDLIKYLAGRSEEYDEEIELESEIVVKGNNTLACDFSIRTKVGLPGDNSKDFSSNENVEILEVRKYKVPFFRVKFNYNGKEKSFEHNALVDKFSVTLDKDETEELKYKPLDTEKIAKEEVKTLTKLRNIAWLSIIPIGIFLGILGMSEVVKSTFLSSIIPVAVFIIAIVLTVRRSSKYNSIKGELDYKEKKKKENILNEKQKKVYEVLKKALKNHGLKSATFDEVYAKAKE